MCFIVELRTPSCPAAYVIAQAISGDDARAQVHAQLERNEDGADIIIVAVHPVH
ncbi:MAG: hypothetical protein IT529_21110 [Burkholderiales bacterium]|nr:hypothetical protein [Burkholderiales bacterium]